MRTLRLYDQHTKLALEVTYGTSRLKLDERQHDLVVANAEEMLAPVQQDTDRRPPSSRDRQTIRNSKGGSGALGPSSKTAVSPPGLITGPF